MGNNLVYVDPGKNNQIHCQAPNNEVILKGYIAPSPTPSTTPGLTPSLTPSLTPTPSCERPGGLTEYHFRTSNSIEGNFTTSRIDSCIALDSSSGSWGGQYNQVTTLAVGGTVYSGTGTGCNKLWTSWPHVLSGGTYYSIGVEDGIIIEYPVNCGRIELDVNPSAVASSSLACANETFVANCYLQTGYTEPTVGAMIYTTAEGSTGFGSSCPNWLSITDGVTKWACQVANNAGSGGEPCENPTGLIRTVVECVPPTPTPTPSITPSISVTPTVTPTLTPTPSITPTSGPAEATVVSCWSFDESSGTIYDEVGSNDLTTTYDVAYSQSGKIGTSCNFNQNWSKAFGTASFSLTDQSHSFWIHMDGTKALSPHISSNYYHATSGGFMISMPSYGNEVVFNVFDTSDNPIGAVTSSSGVTVGGWTHVVVTHKASDNGLTEFWFNGESDITGSTLTGATAVTGTNTVGLGGHPQFNGYSINGDLDTYSLWDGILTSSQISTLYNSGSGQACT